MPEIDPHEAGERLHVAITAAYGKPALVHNENQLAKRSGVARSVIRGWRTGVMPTPVNMQRVAETLGVPAEDLWLRWLGYEAPEPGLTLIAKEIKALRDTIRRAGGGDAQTRDALAAVAAAREDLLEEPEVDLPAEPAASSPRRRPVA